MWNLVSSSRAWPSGVRIIKSGNAGANKFVWNGKISGHKLAPRTYELVATPAGGASQTVTFTIAG